MSLAGREIFALDEDVAPPAEDEFAVEDLAACRVVTKEGRPVGLVRGVWDTGGTPLLVLDPDGGGNEIYIPLSRSICPVIDIEAKRIVIDPPDGLLDLNEI